MTGEWKMKLDKRKLSKFDIKQIIANKKSEIISMKKPNIRQITFVDISDLTKQLRDLFNIEPDEELRKIVALINKSNDTVLDVRYLTGKKPIEEMSQLRLMRIQTVFRNEIIDAYGLNEYVRACLHIPENDGFDIFAMKERFYFLVDKANNINAFFAIHAFNNNGHTKGTIKALYVDLSNIYSNDLVFIENS